MNCPNCAQDHGVEGACALGMILGVVADREALGRLTEADVEVAFAEVDVNELWDRWLGPACNYVEDLLLAARAEVAP